MDEALKDNKGVSGSDLEEDNNITLMDSESAESVPEDKTDGSINTSESTDETKKTEETAGEAVSVQTGESDTGCESAEEKTEFFWMRLKLCLWAQK